MKNACDLINQLSETLVGKDIYAYKKLEATVQAFADRKVEQGVKVGTNVVGAVN